jgi:putative transcriptional regulator
MKNRIKEHRQEKSLTQSQLADRVGVSRQTINAIETGKFDPSLPLAFKLSAVFEQSVEDLFDSSDVLLTLNKTLS